MPKIRMPKEVAEAVRERSQGRCELCGLPAPRGVIHHRQPRGMGSTTVSPHVLPNLLYLHDSEHRELHANPAKAYRDGTLVRHPTDPETVPVQTAAGEVWLTSG